MWFVCEYRLYKENPQVETSWGSVRKFTLWHT